MGRPNLSSMRRAKLAPVLARTFAKHGYAGATTALLAKACELRENQLYRLWPSKKAMFLATLEYLYEFDTRRWSQHLTASGSTAEAVRKILAEEGATRGETGLHRLIFAGLHEIDDPEVRQALAAMYRRFHGFIVGVLESQAGSAPKGDASQALPADLGAWALIALGSFTNVAHDLGVFTSATQKRFMTHAGVALAGVPKTKSPRRRKPAPARA